MSKDKPISVIILGAGLGKRMRSELPKVAVSTRNKPMLHHVLAAAIELEPQKTVIITGHKREIVEEVASQFNYPYPLDFAYQATQEGTGHAVKCAEEAFKQDSDYNKNGDIIILSGDVPLITGKTLKAFLDYHHENGSTLSIISAILPEPGSLGRILRHPETGEFERIIEAKDCDTQQLTINEINGGIYAVSASFLWDAVKRLNKNNAQGEYYLTDIVSIAREQNRKVISYKISHHDEILGVNSPLELNQVNSILNRRKIDELLAEGVLIEDTTTTYIDQNVKIGKGTQIGPNVKLVGNTHIGSNVIIEGTAYLVDTVIADNVHIKFCVRAQEAHIAENCSVGPFAHLRPNTKLDTKVKVGNFVETKNATIASNTAVSHLTYLGDCEIGSNSNIGAGTITCNYDGSKKHHTKIGDNVFVGSNSCLVAPVTINSDATIGAGSVITKDVPEKALALSRSEMFLKANYQRKK
jgi:bifunctional UDP-N-acetylglucosamine pyrophosphorylase/glucosamine-1-phosphate N-acetyltransferase